VFQSDRIARHMKVLAGRRVWVARLALVLVGVAAIAMQAAAEGAPAPAKFKPETRAAFDRYVQLTEARNAAELQQGRHWLWVDELPPNNREAAYATLKKGAVILRPIETLDNGEKIRCAGGMIHHWVGVVFLPGAKLSEVLGVLEDYDHHSIYYAPDVERSKIESRDGDHFRVFLRFRRHKVITVVLNTEHDVQYFLDSPTRAHSRSSAVRIAEVENAGNKDEREKPPGDDNGFMWRMETWWRMEERDDGVYVQSEVASLTRDIPTGLGWLIEPFVTGVPKESLTFTLGATRRAVKAKKAAVADGPSAAALGPLF
jgi:hypothetical protein